jgi:hypothetical protein
VSALNLTPAHIRFFQHEGVTAAQLQDSMVNNVLYQSVMRGSLRDLNAIADCHVIVPDLAMAHSLAGHFSGCHVHDATDGVELIDARKPGRPSKNQNPMTSTERSRLYRIKQNIGRNGDDHIELVT